MVVCAPLETEAGGLQIQDQPGLLSEVMDSLGNLEFVSKRKKRGGYSSSA